MRQLEAVIRIAESLAKMTLSPIADKEHVQEAIRLFEVSTIDAANSGVATGENLSPEIMQQIAALEALMKRRYKITFRSRGGAHSALSIAIGSKALVQQLVKEFESSHSFSENVVRQAINILVMRDEFEYLNQRKKIKRKR